MAIGNGIGETIAAFIRQLVLDIYTIVTPILTVLGLAQILVGLLLAMGLRQEFIGYRLTISGILTLIFAYIIAPWLLNFI